MGKKKPAPTKVESIRHKYKRKNIPTEELRDFVADEELKPKTMLYPRDPSLDPQLVWKGKDQQDRADLAVPVVPIYIQEKIHPQAIIDAKYPYYLLADSPEGIKKEAELASLPRQRGETPAPTPAADATGSPDIRKRFVYKRVPHVTLKSSPTTRISKRG
jgi:hypothetical protein